MKKQLSVLLVLAVAISGLTACGAAPTATAPPAPTARPTATSLAVGPSPTVAAKATTPPGQPTTAPSPTAPATSQATAVPAVVPTEGTLSINSRAEGLDKLKSYRMRWQSQWSSTESGSSDKGAWDWIEEYTANPEALHWTWAVTAATDSSSGKMETWQIGDTTYMLTYDDQNKATCVSISSADKNSALSKGIFSPASLGRVSGATYAGAETVNGLKAKHYKYDERSFVLTGFGKVTGDVWVAVDGGYVVKDSVKWEGSAGPFSANSKASGQGSWTWELTDVNQSLTIKAPDNCSGAASNLPIMPDATNKAVMGDLINYTTPSKSADVIAFYQKEMVKAGWVAADEEPTISAGFATLPFTKDGQTATITIISDEKQTTVMINVDKGQ